ALDRPFGVVATVVLRAPGVLAAQAARGTALKDAERIGAPDLVAALIDRDGGHLEIADADIAFDLDVQPGARGRSQIDGRVAGLTGDLHVVEREADSGRERVAVEELIDG